MVSFLVSNFFFSPGTLEKFKKEREEAMAQLEKAQKKKGKRTDQDEGTIQSLSMGLRRNGRYVKELEMLWFCFSGARIFFRFDVDDPPPKKEEEKPAEGGDAAAAGGEAGSGGGAEASGGAPPPPPPPPPN